MDYESYTSLEQFDMNKINQFAKLDAIPGFVLLRSEKEYLEKYREILAQQLEAQKMFEEEASGNSTEQKEEKPVKKSKKKTEE